MIITNNWLDGYQIICFETNLSYLAAQKKFYIRGTASFSDPVVSDISYTNPLVSDVEFTDPIQADISYK